MPVINRALVKAGCADISSIVTTFDSGGDTGRMRTDERGHILAYSDFWRSLMSLWSDGEHKRAWEEMLLYRDDRGRNFGNTFFRFLADRTGDPREIDALFEQLIGVKLQGKVIPVSLEPAQICFATRSGRTYEGEHHLDELRMSLDQVENIWLKPGVCASEEAIEAIQRAEMVVICPGSLYGSILANFLPEGMVSAFQRTKARRILLTNIVSVANETYRASLADYVAIFGRQLGMPQPFDLVVLPDLGLLDQGALQRSLRLYALEHAYPFADRGADHLPVIRADIARLDDRFSRLRHCEDKLAAFFRGLQD